MNIIFHHPLPLNPKAKSASGIRPLRMLSAFKDIGCQVDLVTGYTAERKACIEKIKSKINEGYKYDFVYSESSTMPTILTDKHHLPLHPLIELNFFRLCKKNNIPVGLFYRDIYWLFDGYGSGQNALVSFFAKVSYKFDLLVYKLFITKLYLPSLRMGDYVPYVDKSYFQALPPGHDSPESKAYSNESSYQGRVSIFYVGGIGEHYKMHELLKVVSHFSEIELTICTRKEEWDAVKSEYVALTDNIKVVHESGNEMVKLLEQSDIASLFVEPQEYREFASPVKLYEYIGYKKPILTSKNTLVGRFVADNDIGWEVDYEENALEQFLTTLLSSRNDLVSKRKQLDTLSNQHSWVSRANQVVKSLME